jgi:uncharacterized protein (UPF0332 family)
MVRVLKRFSFEDCVEQGLIRRIVPSASAAESSLRASERWLEEAEKGLRAGALNSSVMSSYLAMFHSARAVLFKDGYREKSHYCISRYLEEKYVKEKRLESKWVGLLDYSRELRHESQYDAIFVTSEKEAERSLGTAKEFVERFRALVAA